MEDFVVTSTRVNPPLLETAAKCSGNGQRLLGLLRRRDTALRLTVECLQQILAATEKRGLLQCDVAAAEAVLLSGDASEKQNHHQRGKRKSKNNELLSMQETTQSLDKAKQGGPALDSLLLFSAFLRVLENVDMDILLVALVANILQAAGLFTERTTCTDNIFLAEYELFATHGKALLSGLEQHAESLLRQQASSCDDGHDEEELHYTISSCMRAATVLVRLLGTKLSRCTSLLQSWRSTALDGVFGSLLANLCFAGGIDTTPVALWNQSVVDSTTVLESWVLVATGSPNKVSLSKPMGKLLNTWTTKVQQASTEISKVKLILQLVDGLVGWLVGLLNVAAASAASNQRALLGAQFNVEATIYLIEFLHLVSSNAEATFYRTKKRLRLEIHGLLSPYGVATQLANPLRLACHKLLEAVLSTLSTYALLPSARRILKLASSLLKSSSSTAVQLTTEPALAMQLQGQRQRWLHTSIPVRTSAVNMFRRVIETFGTDPLNLKAAQRMKDRDLDKAISIVCGSTVEALSRRRAVEWGSLDECFQLVVACLDCLTASLTAGGQYLGPLTRNLIESTLTMCISSLPRNGTLTLHQATARVALSRAASTCQCIPWRDGARSSFDVKAFEAVDDIRALRDALDCPRVPAISIVKRTDTFHAVNGAVFSADEMADKVCKAQREVEVVAKRQSEKYENDLIAKKAKIAPPQLPAHSSDARTWESKQRTEKDVVSPVQLTTGDTKKDLNEEKESAEATKQVEIDVPVETHAVALSPHDNGEDEFPPIVDCGPDEEDA